MAYKGDKGENWSRGMNDYNLANGLTFFFILIVFISAGKASFLE